MTWHVAARSRGFGWRIVSDRRLKVSLWHPPVPFAVVPIGKGTRLPLSLSFFNAVCDAVAGLPSIAVIEVLFDHAGRV